MDIELLETPRTYVSPSSDKQNTRFTVDEETPPPSAVSVYEGPPDPFTTTAHSTVSNSHNTLDPNEDFPDGGLHSWLVVLGSFFLLMASYGLMNSLGVLQSYFAENQLANYSTRDVGWIPGLFVFLALMLGVQVGPLFDRYGPKGIVLAGSCCYVASLFLLAESKTYWQFILSFGVLGGIGAALVSTSAMASVPQWFRRRAGVAMGIAMAGSGVGGTVFPFVLRAGFARWGFKWGIRLLAFLILFMCLVGSLLVKSRLPKGRAGGTVSLKCFKDPRFTWLSVGIFSLELQVFAGLGLYPTYIVMQGFSSNTSIILLAVLNIGSCVGRFLVGIVADHYGRINVLTFLIALGATSIFAIWLPFGHSLPGLYLFSVFFGLASGSFLSLAPVCIGQISKVSEIGMRFGTCYSLVSFATLICIPIGGEMLEKVGKQAMVSYLGSVLILALLMFVMARWACLNYRWRWRMKI